MVESFFERLQCCEVGQILIPCHAAESCEEGVAQVPILTHSLMLLAPRSLRIFH